MSDSIFRPLFHEVPQAILEAAVKEAEERKREAEEPKLNLTRAAMDSARWRWMIEQLVIGSNYSWRLVDVVLMSNRACTVVRVRLDCGHPGRFFIDEEPLKLYGSPADVFKHIMSILDQEPLSRCTCGTPQGLGPAGKGSL